MRYLLVNFALYKMNTFMNKNILMIIPKFYGYENQIETSLEDRGAYVHVIYDNLEGLNYIYRFICVYIPKLKSVLCKLYYFRKIQKLDKNIDFVFVIKGSSLTNEIIKSMKKRFKETTTYIYYLWDNSANCPSCINISDEFDKVATFDKEDANKFGWDFRPLFFIPRLCKNKVRNIEVLYTGAVHSKRSYIIQKIKKITHDNHLSATISLYSKRLVYYKKKYIDRKEEYKILNRNDVTFAPLSVAQMYELYSKTKVIVDYTHPSQNGFTMRTIESIGNNSKLLTNNTQILNADFYNKDNIFVYDDTFNIPREFFYTSYKPVNSNILEKYTIDRWLNDIFAL